MTVVDFVAKRAVKKEANDPHRSGEARCLNCKHEWVAVAPVGVISLECPKCSTLQGMFKGVSQTEREQWQCRCGEWMFFVDEAGMYCAHCGIRPDFP